jgi:hypothetical protein
VSREPPAAKGIHHDHRNPTIIVRGRLVLGGKLSRRGAYDVLVSSDSSTPMRARLANATERLISQCMSAHGQTYYPELTPVGKAQAVSRLIPVVPTYGSLASRQVNGYGLYARAVTKAAAKREPPTSAMTEDQYIGGLPASTRAGYSTLLFGSATYALKVTLPEGVVSTIRSGGCRATAVDRLYGSVARYAFAFEGASLLTLHFIDQIKASKPFRASLRNWSACMRADGDDYADPNAAYNSLATQYDAQGPVASLRQRELRVGTDDLTCAHRTKLLQTVQALQSQPTRWLTKLELGQLLTITRIDQAALTRADKLRL